MFDAAPALYEPDTEVADVEEPERPYVSRSITTDVVMHVMIDGEYHRRSPGLGRSSCGRPYHSQYAPVRPETLKHPLSRECGCFTPFELEEADKSTRLEHELDEVIGGR
jgi:hypothetical protein